MQEKFKDLPFDEETTILFRSPMKLGAFDIVYEKWRWEGIEAESIIFLSEDVKRLDDAALEAEVRKSPLVEKDSKVTMKRGEKYTFVNFNFQSV